MVEEEKKELPPIVMISEAQFIEKQLTPAWITATTGLAKEVKELDKAPVKAILVEAINRGEITDDDFLPFYDEMPKAEEGKDPILFEDAKECVLQYAISIKMIPTRLKTALDTYNDGLTQVERQIYDFFKNDSLTDVTLIHPTTGALYR